VTCRPYDVVVVPFPFSDRGTVKRRPALVLSEDKFNAQSGHSVLAMITSAGNPPWPLDVPIGSLESGLRAASKVRMKLFTLDNRLIIEKAGHLSQADQINVGQALRKLLGR
jgi:mRNA interferase MazF